jgi:hypothetical protein
MRPSEDEIVGRPSGMVTLIPPPSAGGGGGGGSRLRLCGGLRRLRLRGRGPGRVLPRLLCRLLSLASFFFRALRFASGLPELLLSLPEFAFELLQLVLEITHLPFDRFDPVDWGILRAGRGRYHRRTKCNQRTTVAVRFARHIRSPFRDEGGEAY